MSIVPTLRRFAAPALIWALGWGLMLALDPALELANLALLLVLASVLASPWLDLRWALAANFIAVLAFSWAFVPPRGSFRIDLHQHAWLLAAMLGASWSTAGLMSRLRRQAHIAERHAREARQLREFGEALRDAAATPQAQGQVLIEALTALTGGPVRLLLLLADTELVLGGELDADQRSGLLHCQRGATPFGPGTGRHEELPHWYLPLHGPGAALLPAHEDETLRAQAQLLCDQLGLALARGASERQAEDARAQAAAQGLRNTLLAAISHDYRTPLATIMGAASALQAQDERLSPAQRHKLAGTIVDETQALARLTDNTLQLARLDAPGVALKRDWESAEDLVGAALRRVRQRHPEARIKARLEPGLPLLRCDPLLLMQLLDNLVDNALKHGGDAAPVEIRVDRSDEQLCIAVRDRGPGVPPALRARIFEAWQRGDAAGAPGHGVGLAACRAIARAHGGELRYRARSHGGASFECWLPLEAQP